MTMKLMRIIIAFILVLVIAVGSYKYLSRKEKLPYDFALVKRGDIIQEVSATGTIKKGEEIKLAFKNTGQIEKIYVKIGDKVESGQSLTKLDTTQLSIQLKEAQAALEVAEAKKADAQISLENAERDLKNIKEKAEEDLNNTYEDVLTVLDDAYLKIYNTFNVVHNIQKTYFSVLVGYGLEVREEKTRIKTALRKVESLLNSVKNDPQHENIDSAFSQTKEMLEKVGNAIKGIRDITENAVYREIVSSTDKSSLDTQKLNINTVLANVINAQQNTSAIKITNTTNINNAEAKVSILRSQLESGGDTIGLYQAQINQARAQVALLENQIQEATIISPIEGQITKINKKLGEMVQPSESIISLISQDPFQIEVDIPEADIGKINLADSVKITLDAFPETEFSGKVIEIEPAETIIQGVVYYRVKTSLEVEDTKIKPGMTVNIIITTDVRENVLIIPQRAIIEKNDKKMVRIPVDKNYQEVEVQTGLRGSEGEIEIISGLKKGDKVVTFMRD